MNLSLLSVMLAAAGSPPAADDQRAVLLKNMLLIFGMVAVVYLVMLRPQSKKAKEQANMLKTIKPGDKIITASGIVGTVVAVKDKTLSMRSADTKLEILKSAVTDITERGGETAGAE
jgi:preprotein translocase subunit YajC